jgi:hypothetical protein
MTTFTIDSDDHILPLPPVTSNRMMPITSATLMSCVKSPHGGPPHG